MFISRHPLRYANMFGSLFICYVCLISLASVSGSAETEGHIEEPARSRNSRMGAPPPISPELSKDASSLSAKSKTRDQRQIERSANAQNFLLHTNQGASTNGGDKPLGGLTHRQLIALLGSTGLSDQEVAALTALDQPAPQPQVQTLDQTPLETLLLNSLQLPSSQVQHNSVSNAVHAPALVRSPAPARPRCLAGFSVRKGLLPSQGDIPTRLHFQDTLTNIGGWQARTQQFEAPCDGLYYFSFQALSTKEEDFTIALIKDGVYQVTAYGSKGGYQWGSNSAVLLLRAGSKVYLELQQGAIYEHPKEEAYTTFNGFLINQF